MFKVFYILSTSLFLTGLSFELFAQPSFALNGSSTLLTDNCYQLTSGQSMNDVGSLWCEFPLELNNVLDLNFAVNLGIHWKPSPKHCSNGARKLTIAMIGSTKSNVCIGWNKIKNITPRFFK